MLKKIPLCKNDPLEKIGASSDAEALVNINNILWVESCRRGSVIHFDNSTIKTPMTVDEVGAVFSDESTYAVEISNENLPCAV